MPSPFKAWMDFIRFASDVKYSARHVLTDDTVAFLDALYRSGNGRHCRITKGGEVWRAQAGHETHVCDDGEQSLEEPRPYLPDRMKPLRAAAVEGRANPKGIPCLYVATTRETAMSEVRPWVGSTLSLGQFELTKDLKLVDFSVGHDSTLEPLLFKHTAEELDDSIWAQVDKAFSKPVGTTPSTAEYVPTQIIAEFFRAKGFDGVRYKSKLAAGFNIALFDLDAARLHTCSLVKVKSVEFTFGELERTYRAK
jgi:RES domain